MVGGGGGGGASDIRFTADLNTRIIVAGGGGGGGKYSPGGAGGGSTGKKSVWGSTIVNEGGTQISGFKFGQGGDGKKGVNGSSKAEGHGGGGGGYWGGGASPESGDNNTTGGGGGSGFVHGYQDTQGDLNNPIPDNYKNHQFSGDFACKAGDEKGVPANPNADGNGHIRVSYRTAAMLE
jgi:hypothetical protein